jgi:hypothetical protein
VQNFAVKLKTLRTRKQPRAKPEEVIRVSNRGRKNELGETVRFHLFVPKPDHQRASQLSARYKEQGIRGCSVAYIYRMGGVRMMDELESNLDKARKGKFHAKQRNGTTKH